MPTLLTGFSGFAAGHLTQLLPCIPLADPDGSPTELRSRDAVLESIRRVEFDNVIHLAAQSSVAESFKRPRETFDVNFYGTLNLLECLKESGFRGRFLYVGTADVYGAVPDQLLPVREEVAPHPRNPYAVSKVAAEALAFQWSQSEGFDIVLCRPFNHTGPGQSDTFFLPTVARQIAQHRHGPALSSLQLGNLSITRDFSDVRDVVRAYTLLLERGRCGEIYNICSGIERSLRSVVDALQQIAGTRVAIITSAAKQRRGEQARMFGDSSKLTEHTDWKPSVPFEQTLADLLHYWEAKLSHE